MAIFKDGHWHGVTGSVSMYNRKGKTVSRALPKKDKKISPAMVVSQQHFSYVVNLVRKMKDAADIGYKDYDQMRAPYNVGISINLAKYKLARMDDKTSNLAWFEIAKGDLSNATSFTMTIENESILITWDGTEEWKSQNSNDYLVAAVYNVTKDKGDVYITSQQRSDMSTKIPLNECSEGDVLEVFAFFHVHQFKYVNGGKANVSNSKWLGQLEFHSDPNRLMV